MGHIIKKIHGITEGNTNRKLNVDLLGNLLGKLGGKKEKLYIKLDNDNKNDNEHDNDEDGILKHVKQCTEGGNDISIKELVLKSNIIFNHYTQ